MFEMSAIEMLVSSAGGAVMGQAATAAMALCVGAAVLLMAAWAAAELFRERA